MKIIYGSTFSGIGGFEEAIRLVFPDAECAFYSEIDKFAIRCYQIHYPNHKNVGDIENVDIAGLPDINLLVGGSPCQDLSVAKKDRKGLDGKRSKLFFKYLEILKVKRPKYFVLENVKSMPKESKERITQLLKEIYPETICTMIDAALVSAQSRKRLFWTNFPIYLPEDRGIFLKDILEPEVDEKYFIRNPKVLEKLTYMKGKKKKPNGFQEGAIRFPQNGQEKAFPVLTGETSISRTSNFVAQAQRVYDSERGKSVTLSSNGGGLGAKTGLYIMPDKSYSIDANYCKGTSVENYFQRKKRQIVSGCALGTYPRYPNGEPRNKNCEERQDGKSNALTSVQTDSMVRNFGIRKLTPTECERLQSFSDGWTSMLSNTQRYKTLGNAVNVEVVRHIMKWLKVYDKHQDCFEGFNVK